MLWCQSSLSAWIVRKHHLWPHLLRHCTQHSFLGSRPLIRMLMGSQAEPQCARMPVLHLSLNAAQVFMGVGMGEPHSPFCFSRSLCLCRWIPFIPLLLPQTPRLSISVYKETTRYSCQWLLLSVLPHIPYLCNEAQTACGNGPKRKRENQRQWRQNK